MSYRHLTQEQISSFLYLAPNGQVFNAGPQQTARYLDTSGTGAWTTLDVLVTGGSGLPGFDNPAGAVMYAEMWNPITTVIPKTANCYRLLPTFPGGFAARCEEWLCLSDEPPKFS